MSNWYRLAAVLIVLYAHAWCVKNELAVWGMVISVIAAAAAWRVTPRWHSWHGLPWKRVAGFALAYSIAGEIDANSLAGMAAMLAAFAWLFAGPTVDPSAEPVAQSEA